MSLPNRKATGITKNVVPVAFFVYARVHFYVRLSTFLCTLEYIFVYTQVHLSVHKMVFLYRKYYVFNTYLR